MPINSQHSDTTVCSSFSVEDACPYSSNRISAHFLFFEGFLCQVKNKGVILQPLSPVHSPWQQG